MDRQARLRQQLPEFKPSAPFSVGIKLDLQIVDLQTGQLRHAAPLLISAFAGSSLQAQITPAITQAMIKISSSPHESAEDLLAEMLRIRARLSQAARINQAGIAGGGTHAFARWQDARISHAPQFEYAAGYYGYLANQSAVFGQHVHIGCPSGDAAIALIRQLNSFVPHFIALSAASPFIEGEDTQFACARLNCAAPFPMAGSMPAFDDYAAFQAHCIDAVRIGAITSVNDVQWDIRPRPAYGTLEIRVFDTPLTVERACLMAAFAQTLAGFLSERTIQAMMVNPVALAVNKFRACRFGLFADTIRPDGSTVRLREDLLTLFELLEPTARWLGTGDALLALQDGVQRYESDVRWLRQIHGRGMDWSQIVLAQAHRWMGDAPEPSLQRRAAPALAGS